MAITRSVPQWHCRVRRIDLSAVLEVTLADFFNCRRAASKEKLFGSTSTDVGPVAGVRDKTLRWAGPLTKLLNRSGGLPTHHDDAEVAEGHGIVGPSARSFPD